MPFEVALVAMPWPLAERPSIQLAVLKSYLVQQFQSAVNVRVFHPYVSVAANLGLDLYQKVAGRSWLAESVYAPLLFPEQLPYAQALVDRLGGRRLGVDPLDLKVMGQQIADIHRRDNILEQLAQADLVGISVCLAQLTASLYLVRQLKRRSPHVPVVIGGSSVCGELGLSLLRAFPEVDMVVDGEGERPLAALVAQMMDGPTKARKPIPGLTQRSNGTVCQGPARIQMASLGGLPIPDFSDYFDELRSHPESRHWVGQLPIEGSRGCYWHKTTPQNPRRGCQFCNLNLQWQDYRSKEPRRVAQEVALQAHKHKVLRFCFVDNVLNQGRSLVLFKELQRLNLGLELFAEIRGPLSRESFREMRLAGMKQVQIGIEALSTSLLGKMNKGLQAIDNIEMMKWCEAFGIRNHSNLLLGFPGSDSRDVSETLEAMEFVNCYQPLRVVQFWLGEGSPIQIAADTYGLRQVKNHSWYRAWFPADMLEQLRLMVKEYRGDRNRQRKLWQPVRQRVASWKRGYQAARLSFDGAPLLGYNDGGSFLIVRRRTVERNQADMLRFEGKSREIFLYCDTVRSLEVVCSRFHPLSPRKIEHFIDDLVAKRLVFREGDRILGLALNEDTRSWLDAIDTS
jgi:ribosomal peptide maturation radical SAM protein 1